jgi:hypothetical protein
LKRPRPAKEIEIDMKVENRHQRELVLNISDANRLIDNLASKDDILWPLENWPAMRFDIGLQIGAKGGHGPIRYKVTDYTPGRYIRFQFTAPPGFYGYHALNLIEIDESRVKLTHDVIMKIGGPALFTWPFIFRPLHDALLEDALTKAEIFAGMTDRPVPWSFWVKFLRQIFKKG